MTRNKLQTSKKTRDTFSGTEVGTLIEDFTSQVKLVAEGVSGLNDRFDGLEAKMDNLEVKVDRIEADVEVIKMDIEIIKHDLKNKVSRDEFAVLERRVALLESRR